MKKSRTARVVITPEASVLKSLRQRHGFSMRIAGLKLGYSDSYISQIENGRENIPTGEKLSRFLKLYGDISEKYFKQLCKDWQEEVNDSDILMELSKKMSKQNLKILVSVAKQMAEGKI